MGVAGGREREPQTAARRREAAPDRGRLRSLTLKSRTWSFPRATSSPWLASSRWTWAARRTARSWAASACEPTRSALASSCASVLLVVSWLRLSAPRPLWMRRTEPARPPCLCARPPCRSRSASSMLASFSSRVTTVTACTGPPAGAPGTGPGSSALSPMIPDRPARPGSPRSRRLRSGLGPPSGLLPSSGRDSGGRSWPSPGWREEGTGPREGGMSAGGVLRLRPPSCRPAPGTRGRAGWLGLRIRPTPPGQLSLSLRVPLLHANSLVYFFLESTLPTAKGEPWKVLLCASSGQRNQVRKAKE